ncbi:hypothetical protein NPIL_377521 [Nephila pilipes]|uniref:Uncharacterized protein n=1 Tax=Nephila pilipes TaxID=299642 RepID=A0A8X6JXA8_NEPPI|nr:hypothetical protein NPIL_377521 [Nephila pilipes]
MHFSIPDTLEVKDDNSSYIAYNLHVNGAFHCTNSSDLNSMNIDEVFKYGFLSELLYDGKKKKFEQILTDLCAKRM